MFAWTRRLFASWSEFAEYLVFLSVCLAGILRDVFARAGAIDREWRELGNLALRNEKIALGFGLYVRARALPFVLAMKIGHDCLFMAGAYLFGMAAGWFWGVP
jgi:hypothetical protein